MKLDSPYDMELERIVSVVKEKNYSKICLQLPDGLKVHAVDIADFVKKETGVEIIIWAGSNFGACDIPIEVERLGVDALFHFGHSKWRY